MPETKLALVCGAGGFIGGHLAERLRCEGYTVHGVDLKNHEFRSTVADEFFLCDLRDEQDVRNIFQSYSYNEVYQLAADMGGAGYLFTGEHDADVLLNSVSINSNILKALGSARGCRIFYSSSACIYPEYLQQNAENVSLKEADAYPAQPDCEYGWEKLFSERLYQAFYRNYQLDIRIARFHNVFGPYGTWKGGKEKAPAALCRKVAEAKDGGSIQIWGDGQQTRSFLYVDECIEGVRRLMNSNLTDPCNIGSSENVTIAGLANLIIHISGKQIALECVDGPVGVRGRCSNNTFIESSLGWCPQQPLEAGIVPTYRWIKEQVEGV